MTKDQQFWVRNLSRLFTRVLAGWTCPTCNLPQTLRQLKLVVIPRDARSLVGNVVLRTARLRQAGL